jgi:hypothetical protein
MKNETAKLAQSVVETQAQMSTLTVDKVNELAGKSEEPTPQEESLENLAKSEGCPYIKPLRRLSPPLGTLPDKLKAEHKRAWEYVKGIYENYVINGEPIKFSLCLYPGDADYMWEIPTNIPVYVPRMVAKHLEECQKYHTFSQLAATAEPVAMHSGDVESMRWFRPTGTHYRGKFRPIGAFS